MACNILVCVHQVKVPYHFDHRLITQYKDWRPIKEIFYSNMQMRWTSMKEE